MKPCGAPKNNCNAGGPHARHWSKDPNLCMRGHLLTGDNLGLETRGFRFCKKCKKERAKRYREGSHIKQIK